MPQTVVTVVSNLINHPTVGYTQQLNPLQLERCFLEKNVPHSSHLFPFFTPLSFFYLREFDANVSPTKNGATRLTDESVRRCRSKQCPAKEWSHKTRVCAKRVRPYCTNSVKHKYGPKLSYNSVLGPRRVSSQNVG